MPISVVTVPALYLFPVPVFILLPMPPVLLLISALMAFVLPWRMCASHSIMMLGVSVRVGLPETCMPVTLLSDKSQHAAKLTGSMIADDEAERKQSNVMGRADPVFLCHRLLSGTL